MSEDSEKQQGNAAFRRGDCTTALKHYDKAIEDAGDGATATLFSNKAAALQKLANYDLCIEQCLKGLAAPGLTPELKSKIHFRMVLAYEAQGEFEVALNELVQYCERSPAVLEKLNDLTAKLWASDPAAVLSFCNTLAQNAGSRGVDMEAFASTMHRLTMEQPAVRLSRSSGDSSKSHRSKLIAEHNALLQICKEAKLCQYGALPVRFDNTPSCVASTAGLFNLERVTIGQLRLGEINLGKLLICRTITEPLKMIALVTVIEDSDGEATRLAIYNLHSPTNDICSLLPLGTYLAIKEPWYKSDKIDGVRALRVDNPANFVYLEQTHDLLKKVKWRTSSSGFLTSPSPNRPDAWESFQKRANELFVAGNYELAIAAYTDAIELKRKVAPKEEMADLLANRAAAYLGDGKPTDAFWDCQSALYVKPGHLKATIRLAKAQAKLGKYEEAKDVIVKSPHTTRPEFKNEISRLNRLMHEQQKGEYDLKSLLKEAAASEGPRLEHAEYNGGVRRVWISKEKGNGLFAERDFAPGSLLFVSKAFEATYRSDIMRVGLIKDARSIANETLHSECVSRIIQRISTNNNLVKELYQLFAGPDFERFKNTDTDDTLAVNSKRVAAIVDLNAFGCNDFAAELSAAGVPKNHSAGVGFAFDGCGVWILASFMNHSCVPNTVVFYVGDLMFVRAAKRIRKGEELTTSYTSLALCYSKRQETLKKYGFKCECELCISDLERARNQPYLDAQRQSFMDSNLSLSKQIFEAMGGKKTESLGRITEDARKLADEFSHHLAYTNQCDPQLECLCCAVGHGYNAQGKWLQAAKAYEQAYFAAIGKGVQSDNAMPPHLFLRCFDVTNNYQSALQFGKAKEYLDKMRQVAKVCWGSDEVDLLQMLYPELPLKNWLKWSN